MANTVLLAAPDDQQALVEARAYVKENRLAGATKIMRHQQQIIVVRVKDA